MTKTFKTEWFPTAEQREYVHKACGIRRWTWNWAVATFFEAAKHDKFPSSYDLQKQLNNTLVLQDEYAWLSEVNSMVRGEALKDFGLAIKAYANARQRAKRTVEKLPVEKYKPHFKKKGKCTESFRLFKKGGSEFKVHSAHDFSVVRTAGKPRIHVHTRESLAFLKGAEIKTCTFSYKAERYFISIAYEKTNRVAKQCGTGKIGLDLGIKTAVAGFDGSKTIEHHVPLTLDRAEKHTERQNRRLSKTQNGSKRHERALRRLQRAYMHEANCKRDFREKFMTDLVRSYNQINVDDFGFEGAKNLDSCRALYRVGVYAFKIRLSEKCAEYGVALNFVPRGTPTTQTCHVCGSRHKVTLKERVYECPACGLVFDRDLNAAINVYNYC